VTDERAVLHLDGIEKWYASGRRKSLVLSVDRFWFAEGERVLVTGPNGSGKTTFLRVIAGATLVNRGRIRWSESCEKNRLAYVPQQGGVYPALSVRQNLMLRRTLAGLSEKSPKGKWYVDDLGLSPLLDKRIEELSGGFQQLSAVAAALHTDPRCLILDEPLTALDEQRAGRLAGGLEDSAAQLQLLIFSSPDSTSRVTCDRTIELHNGRIQ
jgi:ABC-type multidrug transport system ATPase subunit